MALVGRVDSIPVVLIPCGIVLEIQCACLCIQSGAILFLWRFSQK